jgi:hypothetical protein
VPSSRLDSLSKNGFETKQSIDQSSRRETTNIPSIESASTTRSVTELVTTPSSKITTDQLPGKLVTTVPYIPTITPITTGGGLPTFPSGGNGPVGGSFKRKTKFTEFLPIGQGINWFNVLGNQPNQRVKPNATKSSKVALPKANRQPVVTMPKPITKSKQTPIKSLNIKSPFAKKKGKGLFR